MRVSARFRHQVKGDVAAVRDVSLDVAPGELLTLLGPSGCGKTTTLRMIAGFQEPTAGHILIGERDVTARAGKRRDIGFVFQNYALFPHLSVFENVAYGLRCKRMDGGEIARAVDDVLALVGLARLRAADAAPALRRRAAARRARARHRHPAARAAVRRAALQSRRQAAGQCAAKSATCSAASASRRYTSRTIRKRRWRSPTVSR